MNFIFLIVNGIFFLLESQQTYHKVYMNTPYRSAKSLFSFEESESLPGTPQGLSWRTIHLSQDFAKVLFSNVSLEYNFPLTEHFSSNTIVLCFYSSIYANELLELHLTGVKLFDFDKIPIVSDLHLTLRCKSKTEQSRSYHYTLQHSKSKHFRFVKNEFVANNQTDLMENFIGQQGFHNFSSAVFQPILRTLQGFSDNNRLRFEKNCIKLT